MQSCVLQTPLNTPVRHDLVYISPAVVRMDGHDITKTVLRPTSPLDLDEIRVHSSCSSLGMRTTWEHM